MAFTTVFCLSLFAALHASAQTSEVPSVPSASPITSSAATLATPTASPTPPISSTAQELIDELSTAILYAELFSNGGSAEDLCRLINPASLDEIGGIAINGSAVQEEVCALASIEASNPSLGATVVSANQLAVQYLATALFAVQVAGNYAGGPNLATLCSEIETTLINNIFIGYVPNGGTAVKNFVCSAASASATSTASCPTATTPPPYPLNVTTTSTTGCASPTGYANTVVPAPSALARSNFQIAPAFAAAHEVVEFRSVDITASEASIATECLKRCVAYKPNGKTGPCLSFNVNLGKPIPPTGNGGPTQWFCSGFDAYLANDGSDFLPVPVGGSYMFGLDVNRVCNGTYRAY